MPFTPRTMTNLPGLTRDPADTKNLFAEDWNEMIAYLLSVGTENNTLDTVSTEIGNDTATPTVPVKTFTIPADFLANDGDTLELYAVFLFGDYTTGDKFEIKMLTYSLAYQEGIPLDHYGIPADALIKIMRTGSDELKVWGKSKPVGYLESNAIITISGVDFSIDIDIDVLLDGAIDDRMTLQWAYLKKIATGV